MRQSDPGPQHQPGGRLRARPARRRPTTGRPAVEAIEVRWLPSLTFQFADPVGVVGTGSVDVESNSVVNDAAGNVYVTGSLQGTADFDPGPGVSNLSSTGGRDVFVAKYDQTGTLVWADDLRGAGGSSVAQGGAVVVDGSGHIVVTGSYTGTVNFDPKTVNPAATFTAPQGGNDVFIAEYDANGSLLWARDVAGTAGAIDEGYALAADGSGNVVAAGSFSGTATFGTAALTAGGNFDSFVTKLSPSGQFLWARATTGSGTSVAQANGVSVDGSGNVITTGFYAGAVDFDPGAGVSTLPYVGAEDIYVQKLDPAGNLIWAESVSSPDINQGLGVAADAAGNVVVTGTFSMTANFNPGAGAAVNLTAGGFQDAFLLKLDPSGRLTWVKDLSASQYSAARGTGVALDGSGDAFVAGYYQNGLTLDPTAPGAVLSGAGSFDVFVGEYDASGNYLAARSAGGSNFDAAFGIGVNASGEVAIAGRYSGPAAFGTITLPAQPGKSIFIAQLASPAPVVVPPPQPGAPILEAGSDTGTSQTDRITNATTLVFDENTVSAPGNLVRLFRDGVPVAGRTGAGPITDPGPVPDGVHTYTAQQTGSSGLVSTFSTGVSVTVVTKAPPTPAAPALNPLDDSGAIGDGITNVRQPRLIGIADPNALVQLLDSFGNVLGSTTTAADGSYTFTVGSPLSDGPAPFRVREQDAAGNLSASSPGMSLTIDATPPPVPSTPTISPTDDSGTPGDGVTNVNQPRLVGSAPAGTTVQLVGAGGVVLATSASTSGGTYTLTPSQALSDGSYTLTVRAVDAAGNVSAPGGSLALTILATPPGAPAAPALSTADDTGRLGDGKTAVRRPRLVGPAPPGSAVDLLDPAGNVLSSATVGAGGTYSLQPASNLIAGATSLRVRVRDVAGNVGPAGPAFALTVVDASPGDFDGDGKTDVAVFRPSASLWIGQNSSGGSFVTAFGDPAHGDIAVPADYDGLGRSELAVYRPSTGVWIINGPTGARIVSFGDPANHDIPVPGDYDGVGHAELAVFRPATAQWLIASPTGLRVVQFGESNLADIPVPGDYDGLGHTEFALFRPATAQWLIASPAGLRVVQFGEPNLADIPVPGDYDGTGRTELALFRPVSATWIIKGPTSLRFLAFGEHNLVDIPVEAPFGSLKTLGTVGGIHLSSAAVAVAAPASVSVGGGTSTPAKATTKPVQPAVSVPRKLAQSYVDAALNSLFANAPGS